MDADDCPAVDRGLDGPDRGTGETDAMRKSWACMAPKRPTRPSAVFCLVPAICWLASRRRAMSKDFVAVIFGL
jgi:hypothetical protein